MRLSQWISVLVVMLFSDACVEPLSVPIIRSERKLVIDGLITNTPGPYKVKIFMSAYLNEELDQPRAVSGAVVKITDDLGNEEILTEEASGQYVTDGSMQGEVGRKYRLDVQTTDGKTYQSEMEEIKSPGEVENVYFEFKANSINRNDLTLPQDAFWIYVDAKGTAGEKNLLRWRWTGTFQSLTFPHLRIKRDGINEIPDPIPCSGYIAPDGVLQQVAPCTCCECWTPQYNRDVLISKNEFSTTTEFKKVLIGKVPVDKVYFLEKYHIGVEQLTLSEEVYDFWKLLESSKQGSENIFQPNAVKVKGNIRCLSDEDEEVFGIFSASSVVQNDVFIHRYDIPKSINDPDSLIIDCRQLYPGSTNQKPPFW
jgi:hypothetical protein